MSELINKNTIDWDVIFKMSLILSMTLKLSLLAEILLSRDFSVHYTLFVAGICNSIVIRQVSPTFKDSHTAALI